ncbi:proton extrusion protein PcxA [Calothrix rhizosoleniae]|uniref:proton extrusion protein PcxA n=1 Tax=Calothrix rhizosoleniae TaxID=888997 RepID=UPI000B4A265D|nr:proton extrusion protein PcxA [Calothrix rhizosoleniae]
MNNSVFRNKIYPLLQTAYRWYSKTPEYFLEVAYQAALKIKAIEDEHFHGNKIAPSTASYSSSVMNYFQADLQKQLQIIEIRLKIFNTSRTFLPVSPTKTVDQESEETDKINLILERLRFIDEVTSKYIEDDQVIYADKLVAKNKGSTSLSSITNKPKIKEKKQLPSTRQQPENRSKANTTGVLPRSIFNTINRLQVELDPNAEQDVVQKFRKSQQRTIISVRFILLLIVVPILTHQLSKAFFVGPLVDKFQLLERLHNSEEVAFFLNYEMEEEALNELHKFEEKVRFENLINESNPLSKEQIKIKIQAEAKHLAERYKKNSDNALKNVFADILSVIAFVWLLVISKRDIAVLKEFVDNIVYGLSDSAKAFIIILFTDVFVGFHSPHGWEVILEGVSRHWGLPANHEFIFLFIATFPVVLDTIFKYWIFRYLNRISPSAVATYRNMNE